MNYVLIKATELAEHLPLSCSYQTELDMQLAIDSIGLGSKNSSQTHFLNYTDLTSPRLEAVLFQFIPEIDFASLHSILNHPILRTKIDPDLLLARYSIPPTAHVYKTLERSIRWSPQVLNWFVQKKVKPHEISFLNLLDEQSVHSLLNQAAISYLSKMETLKLLETLSELVLMKIDVSTYYHQLWTESVIEAVKALRYPQSFVFNPIKQIQLKWPKSVSSQSKRIQDKMGYQVQFFVSHPDELDQTLAQLEKLNVDWTSQLKGLNS